MAQGQGQDEDEQTDSDKNKGTEESTNNKRDTNTKLENDRQYAEIKKKQAIELFFYFFYEHRENIFIYPRIPEDKMNYALKCCHPRAAEEGIIAFIEPPSNSSIRGLLFTAFKLYILDYSMSSQAHAYQKIKDVTIDIEGTFQINQSAKINLPLVYDDLEKMAFFLKAISALEKNSSTPPENIIEMILDDLTKQTLSDQIPLCGPLKLNQDLSLKFKPADGAYIIKPRLVVMSENAYDESITLELDDKKMSFSVKIPCGKRELPFPELNSGMHKIKLSPTTEANVQSTQYFISHVRTNLDRQDHVPTSVKKKTVGSDNDVQHYVQQHLLSLRKEWKDKLTYSDRTYHSNIDLQRVSDETVNFFTSKGSNYTAIKNPEKIEIWASGPYAVILTKIKNGVKISFGRIGAGRTMGASALFGAVFSAGLSVVGGVAIAANRKRIEANFWTFIDQQINVISQVAAIHATSQQTVQPQPQKEDIIEKIKELSELKDQGILTEEEFQTKKKDLLSRL